MITPAGLALLAGLGWAVAALMLGLWWGERGRRCDAQARELYGHALGSRLSPEERVRDAPPGPEERAASATAPSPEEQSRLFRAAVQRGAEKLLAESKAMGRTMSRRQAEEAAAEMLQAAGPIGAG